MFRREISDIKMVGRNRIMNLYPCMLAAAGKTSKFELNTVNYLFVVGTLKYYIVLVRWWILLIPWSGSGNANLDTTVSQRAKKATMAMNTTVVVSLLLEQQFF